MENDLYKSIEDFLDSENLKICYPTQIAYDIKISSIVKTNDNQTIFYFMNPRVAFEIYHDNCKDLTQFSEAELINYNDYYFYIFESEDLFYAYAMIKNDFYVLSCDSKEELIEMIHSFSFERLK